MLRPFVSTPCCMLLRVAGRCCAKFETGQTLATYKREQQLPTLMLGVVASVCTLDTVFHGQYLPSLGTNYVAINKDLEKLPPQLY